MNKFYSKFRVRTHKVLQLLILFFFIFAYAENNTDGEFVFPVEGPGGPILVITSDVNPFSSYTAEILKAEGFNEFSTTDISLISTGNLNNYDVIIVGDIPLTSSNVTLLTDWVNAGGTLITFKPDSKLAPLLGLESAGITLQDSYLLINTASGPGNGLVNETIQFHSEADLYSLNGASSLATLYSSVNTATSYPAVSLNNVGINGGVAVAFTFDLARSIVYTRQGNPDWAGQERDGESPIRSNDMFYPNWVNLAKVAIPQADEQQRLLANIIIQNSQHPMPRFWYLPRGLKAAVVMTGDDHAGGGTYDRFNQYMDMSPDNSPEAVADWRAIRGSSYIYSDTPLSDEEAKYFEDMGFEIALHLFTGCENYTYQSVEADLVSQLSQFKLNYPSLADPVSNRTHCIVFSDWASQPILEESHGIRLDANYYYWPGFWAQDRPGFFTGSGIPMRFADLDGTTINTYQLATQMTDESDQSFPYTIDRLLDNALGPKGYYGVFCANMHTDFGYSPGSDAIIASAQSRNVPVISARQLLTWLDGRSESYFGNLAWDGSTLSFSTAIGEGAFNLEAMLPLQNGTKQLIGLELNGSPVNYRTEKIKGINYGIFSADSGNFIATYEINEPPVVSITSPGNNATFLENDNIEMIASASDPDGDITKVEFFNGNSKLGEDTDGTNGWTFNWLSVESGNYTLTAKATDDKGSFSISEIASVTVNIDPTNIICPCTVFEPTETPGNLLNEGGGIQLGMKFKSGIDGYVSGVRFYKEAGNTGIHTGQLYDNSGNLLAEVAFSNETESGWQEAMFGESVAITKNTTYVISYHSSEGYYSVADSYFQQAKENTPLIGLRTGEDGPNGVYLLSAVPGFPTENYTGSNYWVDVVFNTEPTTVNIPPDLTITSPTAGEYFTAPANVNIAVSATDSDGGVVKVEFFNGLTKLGEDIDSSDGWGYSWNNVSAGNYNLIAKAIDDLGASSESSINFTVSSDPIIPNSIVSENALPGNPPSEWQINGAGDLSIQGFATDISYNKGETARFKIKTGANDYNIKIYRLGYYQGNGARYQGDGTLTANLPQNQPRCIENSGAGLLDCGNWEESAIWQIPTGAVSGIYLALLTRNDTGGSSHIVFVVRDDTSTSDLFFQTSDATWQAYNVYGDNNNGRSLYTGAGGKASKVSYNRPFITRDGGGGGSAEEDFIFNAEYPMIRWLESNGFDVTYTTNVDSDRRGELIKNHKVFLSVGHDEYWSGAQRGYVESARDQGTNLAFFSGNEIYWKTRWENSIDGNGVPYRTLVCYKEGSEGENICGGKCDPNPEWTGLWRSGCEYSTDGCQPENELSGQISWAEADAAISVPSTFKDLRFWRNTSVASLNQGQTVSFTYGTIGYEWNPEQDEYRSSYPDGRILMSRTVVNGDVHNISLYKHTSGSLVFGAGTVQWSWGLDENHARGNDTPSRDMQQATLNLLADMGAQPGSIQSDLIQAAPSTDFEAPIITYSSPAEGGVVLNNTEVIISGTAEETNVLVAVEVSTDNGITWEKAEGTTDWLYSWTPTVEGPATILTRAFDDSGNLSTPASLNISVSNDINNANPVVVINEPVDAASFTAPATINIIATASDADGTISKVEFFNGTVKLGEDLASPYEFSWANVGAGNYSLAARATDDVGAVTISEVINVTVNSDPNNLVCPCTVFEPTDSPAGSVNNDGLALQLGMKFQTTVDGIVTGVRFYKQSGDSGTHIGQLYNPAGVVLAEAEFQNETASGWQQVDFPAPVEITAGTTYIISYHSSDGYYSSDSQGFAQEIVNGPVRGLANGEDGSNGVYNYSATPVFPSSNYLSSNYYVDVVFDTETLSNNLDPVIAITSPLDNDSFVAPADILITADASDTDGNVVSVEFFQGTTSLGIDNDGTDGWSLNWNAVPQGNYVLTAVVTDDVQASVTSSAVNISVSDPLNIEPSVAITSPLDNDSFVAPANIVITTDASDTDGSVVSVEFFEGANSLGVDSDGSNGWSFTWNAVPQGNYVLTAVVTDDAQASVTSSAVNISVSDPLNIEPSVAITSPLDNDSFVAPANIVITADASDTDGSVVSVEFFQGTTSLGIDNDSTDGWSFTWNAVPQGNYVLTAVVTDDAQASVTSSAVNISVSDPLNIEPSVAITSPLENDSFMAPADILITADASDTDGNVVSVEFFQGTTSLGIDNDGIDGWSFTWNAVPQGNYVLTAVVTDDAQASVTSSAVNISVSDPLNIEPSVAITSPLENDSFMAPADILITADASDTDGNVVSVEFFQGTTSLGIDNDGIDGWSFTWNAVPQGNYVLTAVVTDDAQASVTSSAVNIRVSDPPNIEPSVAITSPLDNDSFVAPANILITADALDTDGSVVSVEFFEGSNSLGVDNDGIDGWSFTWNSVSKGNYVLTAVATDNDQTIATSAAININVEPLPAITNFIPSSGPVGSLVMINGTDLEGVTEVLFGPSIAKIISVSSTQIEVRVPPVNGKLPKNVKISLSSSVGQYTSPNKFTVTSGTVVNAAPVAGIISPVNNTSYTSPATVDILASASDADGTVTKVEFYNGNTKIGEDLTSPYEFSWINVPAGTYSLTAIATDDRGSTGTSNAINIQVSDPGGNTAPTVAIMSPVNNASFTAPASVTINASAVDSDGTVAKVEFFNGVTKLGEDLNSPFEFSWNNVPAGNYSLTATATDDLGAITTSEVITITVTASLSIAAPSNLTAQWVSDSQVDLAWQDNHIGEDGFVLERSSKSNFSGKLDYISLPANTVTYQDLNLNSKKGGGSLYYRIKAVKGNLSSDYSNVVLATAVSTALTSSSESLNVSALSQENFLAYPNPTSGEATVEFQLPETVNYSLRLYDSGGGFIAVLQEGKAVAGVKYYYHFDGNSLSDGLYLIHLETSNSIKSLKLLIER